MHNENLDETVPSKPDQDEDDNLAETQASPNLTEDTKAKRKKPKKKGRFRRFMTVILGILAFVLVFILIGIQFGINDRLEFTDTIIGTAVADQFVRGVAELQTGNCDLARQRFEYILSIDPDFPSVEDYLVQAIVCANTLATPTPPATSTIQPTVDLRGEQELYDQALALRNAKQWDQLIETLNALRGANPGYKPVELDGMYFVAYRSRGIDRILLLGDLEGGIYDLTLAERLGPLDSHAINARQWAEWYIVGASFWDLDWGQAVQYFSQIVPVAPQMSDSEYFTAEDRLATAQINWAGDLINDAIFMLVDENYCGAANNFQQAYAYVTPDPLMLPTAEAAYEMC